MKKVVLVMFCMAGGVAWAQDDERSESEEIDSVDLRVSVFENIDVTAEKAPAVSAEELDEDLETILDEAEDLEEE